jgi:hypothetical protein
MKLTLKIGNQTKEILCDDFIDCASLKELCCREAFTPAAYTRLYFGEKLLIGEAQVADLGVTDGATIIVKAPGLD